MDVIQPSMLSSALQGLGNPNSTQHRNSYLAAWLWVWLSLWAVSTPITHCMVTVQESDPQPSTWVLAFWCSIVPVLQSVLRCVLLLLASSTPSPLWSSFSTEHFPFVLVETVSFSSRFHSHSSQLSRQIPAYSQEYEQKWPGFHHCLKLNWLALLPPQWSTQTFVIYLGQLIHMTIRGARLPIVLHSLLSNWDVTGKSSKSILNCFNTLLSYRPPLTKAYKYV